MNLRRMFAHRIPEEILCDRHMASCHRSRIFFSLSIALSAFYLIATGVAMCSANPPALSHVLIGAIVTFALVVTCLEIAASSHQSHADPQVSRI